MVRGVWPAALLVGSIFADFSIGSVWLIIWGGLNPLDLANSLDSIVWIFWVGRSVIVARNPEPIMRKRKRPATRGRNPYDSNRVVTILIIHFLGLGGPLFPPHTPRITDVYARKHSRNFKKIGQLDFCRFPCRLDLVEFLPPPLCGISGPARLGRLARRSGTGPESAQELVGSVTKTEIVAWNPKPTMRKFVRAICSVLTPVSRLPL